MTVIRECDGPGCSESEHDRSDAVEQDWLVVQQEHEDRLDFCSFDCMGKWAIMFQADTNAA